MLRGNVSPLYPSLSTLLLPLMVEESLQESSHSLGVKGARRQDGGQTRTGCESLCVAISHSRHDSSAQSSVMLMQLPCVRGKGGGGQAAEVSAVHPLLSCRDAAVPSRAAFILCMGGAVEAATGEGEKHRAVESPHLQI